MLHHFDPPWRPVIPTSRRRKSRSAVGLACPLAFSMIGLLLDGVVSFGGSDDPQLALLRFALIAGAPVVAALAAMEVGGDGSPA
jgi:hypothetical protein